MPGEATLEQVKAAVLAAMSEKRCTVDKIFNPDISNQLRKSGLVLPLNSAALVKQAKAEVGIMPTTVGQKTLDSSLLELFVRNSRAYPPMTRWDVGLKQKIDGAVGGANVHVTEQTLQKLMTVLCQVEVQQLLDTSVAATTSIQQFLGMGADGQLQLINQLWNYCTTQGSYSCLQSAMQDNTNAVTPGGEPLPSSIHPVRAKGADKVSNFQTGRAGTPFKTLGVGFRVEGSDDPKGKGVEWHINRVVTGGMWPQVTNETLMLNNGYNVAGTAVAAGSGLAPRLNSTQKDLWNESGICVARSFFGATAFPYRETKGKVILWALDVQGLTGFDTEEYQSRVKTQNGPWRPGEKCFPRIDEKRILGWVLVDKLGNGNDGWEFSVARNAKWGATAGTPTPSQRQYIENELAAWAGATASVSTAYDFATPTYVNPLANKMTK